MEENNKSKKTSKKRKAITIVAISLAGVAVVAAIAVPICLSMFDVTSSVETAKRRLSVNAVSIAESNTFKKLNNIKYPEKEEPSKYAFSDNEMSAYNNFVNSTYHSIVDSSKKDNMSYASIGLYSIMNELYGAISRDELKARFDSLLGLDEASRVTFYINVINANSYATKDNTTQLKNAAFFNNKYAYSEEYVNHLTSLFCEAYKIDFTKEADKMVEWVNEAVDSKGFIDKNFLKITDLSQLYYFSTLYFKNAWSSKYLSEDNIDDDFYLSNGSKMTTKYMRHSYMDDSYYDYGTYISFRDYYMNGNASVTYLIPKKTSDNIFDLTKNVNIFEEKEENKVVNRDEYDSEYTMPIMINLETPKFKVATDLDLKDSLYALGFTDMFDYNYDSFHNAFNDPVTYNVNFYLEQVKQKNEVEFNEDGAIVRSLTMAEVDGKCTSAEPLSNELNVKLNQPFIYIIRDCNNVPILVGHIDNPIY